jgi:DNA-binding transcriptional LysR family regulator
MIAARQSEIMVTMDDFRLKVFKTVAERLSFTQAAEILYLTQPAVTLQIKALEEDVGARLFDRGGGHVGLTPAGEILLKYAIRISELYADATRALDGLKDEQRGELAVGASTTIAQYILPRIVGEFIRANPMVNINILGANTAGVVKELLAGRITLGLIEGPAGRTDVKVEQFIEDEIVPIVAHEHPWASAVEPIAATDLPGIPLVLRERGSGTRRVVEDALKEVGLKLRSLNVAMELDSTEAVKSAVEAGLGIGFVSQWALMKERKLATLASVTIQGLRIHRSLQFVYSQGPRPKGLADAFLRFVKREHPKLIYPRLRT